ncbi:MAG: hypothetical protein CM1200mP16_08320 [Nitrospina sp.]|nr:MAG: hypothetical protein CM1200mP16_08320 [Nitrospina sp.]
MELFFKCEDCIEEGLGPIINVPIMKGVCRITLLIHFGMVNSHLLLLKIELGPQMITNPKWPNPSTQQVAIRAVKNGEELVVMLEWKEILEMVLLSIPLLCRRAAIMFPVQSKKKPPSLTMGENGIPVNIWQWKPIGGEKGQPGVKKKKRNSLPNR